MKWFKNRLFLCAALFATGNIYAARSTAAQKQQAVNVPKTTAQRGAKGVKTATPIVIKQQTPTEIKSYWQALNAIKTMSPNMVLKNNLFTADFINFIKALNLSDIENKALLQAGINIHAVWTGNNAQDKSLFSTLKNNIESTLQNLRSISQPQPIPTQQKPVAPMLQQKPTQRVAMKPAAVPTTGNFATNNVIMILDPAKEESVEKHVGAMTNSALQAMSEQAAPIIMTSNILTIIATAQQNIGIQNLQQLRNANFNQIKQLAKQLIQTINIEKFNSTALILLSTINFDTNTFNCYLYKSAHLILIIPKQYITTNLANAANMNAYDQAQACGFNTTDLTVINDLTPNNLLQQLQNQPSAQNEEQLITKLTTLFIPQKRNGELISPERDTKWVMYITGHGSPAHQTIGSVREQLAILKQNQRMGGNRRNAPVQKKSTPQNAELIKSYEKIVEGRSSWPNAQLVPDTARVAGLKMSNFIRLLKFFATILDIAFIHYITCFAGGYNQTFVNEILSSLDVDFIISAEGVDETSVISQTGFTSSNQPPYIRPHNKFTHFFNLVRLFVSNPEQFVKTKQAKKEPVAQILRAIVPNMVEGNQPFVRFPSVGVFGALSLGKMTKKLTQTIVKAHEIENKTINVTDPTINIIVVNSSRINVPLNFGNNKNCAIVSPTPATINPNYQAINVFKEINMQSTLQQLLYDFIHLNARLHTQLFVMNKLTGITTQESGLPQGSINHLIIQMKGVSGSKLGTTNKPSMQAAPISPNDIQYSRMGVNVQIVFELNNTVYQCTMGIKDFEDENLQKDFQQITFTPATDINSIANKFLTAQEISKVTKPITLNSIAQFIDSKINLQEPSLFNEPTTDTGSLRKFFERKPK